MIICVSGTHGTGKSLFLFELQRHFGKQCRLITELYREIIARTPVSRFSDAALQDLATFEIYVRHEMIRDALSTHEIVLVDRHPIDALIYTKFFDADTTKVETILREQMSLWENEDVIIIGFLFGFSYLIPSRLLKPLYDDPVRKATLRLTYTRSYEDAIIEFERLYLQTINEWSIPMKIFKLSDYLTRPLVKTYEARNEAALDYVLSQINNKRKCADVCRST